jgi:HEAT repeat protein
MLVASIMANSYQIDIDTGSGQFSKAFNEFYKNHFINSYGLTRGEVDSSFFVLMTNSEKEIARRLIRNNLHLKQAHLFRAAGELKDEQSLPILYEQLNGNTDLSWLLSIGQAIWKINGDKVYLELLHQLQKHPDGIMKAAHFDQVTDLKDQESIEMLFDYLEDDDSFVRELALSKLNYLVSRQHTLENRFDRKYFLKRRKEEIFKADLLLNLQSLP